MELPSPSKETLFHRFPDLPTELQDLVWFHALPDARIVELQEESFWASNIPINSPAGSDIILHSAQASRIWIQKITDRNAIQPPGALQACQASRRITLPFFKQCNPTAAYGWLPGYYSTLSKTVYYTDFKKVLPVSEMLSPPIWFQPDCDILYMAERNFSSFGGNDLDYPDLGFHHVRHLAVGEGLNGFHHAVQYLSKIIFSLLPTVQTIRVVYDERKYNWVKTHKKYRKRTRMVKSAKRSIEQRWAAEFDDLKHVKVCTEDEILDGFKANDVETVDESFLRLRNLRLG